MISIAKCKQQDKYYYFSPSFFFLQLQFYAICQVRNSKVALVAL